MTARADSESSARRILASWSSTNAFIGYKINARTAGGRPAVSPRRCGTNGDALGFFAPGLFGTSSQVAYGVPLGLCHHRRLRYPGPGAGQRMASLARAANTGNRNDSVLPEPVPDVTMPGLPLSTPLRSISAW